MVSQVNESGAAAPVYGNSRLRAEWTHEMTRPEGPEGSTPWWIGAILVAIFGFAMFLSGVIVGHHLG